MFGLIKKGALSAKASANTHVQAILAANRGPKTADETVDLIKKAVENKSSKRKAEEVCADSQG